MAIQISICNQNPLRGKLRASAPLHNQNNKSQPRHHARAFTLIELLIVVAIIAILAAIAVPNFLEAQVRAKVSRARSDMRTMATGLEAYAVDYNTYPDMFTRMRVITTPVSYITTIPRDPFRVQQPTDNSRFWRQGFYRYGAMPVAGPSRFALASVGPDTDIDTYVDLTPDTDDTADWESDNSALRFYPGYTPQLFTDNGALVNASTYRYIWYDPTNGTVSNGDVFRLSDFAGK
jgi:prepilin-type N-terminal cleavage/methylation domain-containing protein